MREITATANVIASLGVATAADGRVAIRAALSGSNWHDAYLSPEVTFPEVTFDAGTLVSPAPMTLAVSPPNPSALRTALLSGVGITVTVDQVITVTRTDGTSETFTASYAGTWLDTEVQAAGFRITFAADDLFGDKQYPRDIYTASQYPTFNADANDAPVPFCVGTCLKVPARLIAQQTQWSGTAAEPEWLYSLCDVDWSSHAITAVSGSTVTLAGDLTGTLTAGDLLWIFDPADRSNRTHEGRYTVTTAVLSGSNTNVTVSPALTSATVTSAVNIPPRVLAVYRNGRVVGATEYSVEVLDHATPELDPAISDMSDATWAMLASGSGSATRTGNILTFSGDGGGTNWGTARYVPASPIAKPRRGQYAVMQATVAGGKGAAWLASGGDAPPGAGGLVPIADRSVLIRAGAPARWLHRGDSPANDGRLSITTHSVGEDIVGLTIDDLQFTTTLRPLLLLRFKREQRDPAGNLYTLEADILGRRSRNVVDEIERLVLAMGGTVDASSFSAARSVATAQRMLVDCAHGARGSRGVRAILDDLLLVARATLVPTATHALWRIVQDVPVTPSVTLVDRQDGIEVTGVRLRRIGSGIAAGRAAAGVQYRPGGRDPNQLTVKRMRARFFGAILVVQPPARVDSPRQVQYLRDHEAADRLCYYLAQLQDRTEITAKIVGRVLQMGDPVRITAPGWLASGSLDCIVTSRQPSLTGCSVTLREEAQDDYVADVPLPGDPADPFEPDYSQTAPTAPTDFRATARGATFVTVDARPPSVNWESLWFVVTRNSTNEIVGRQLGAYDAATGRASVTLGGLLTGTTYRLAVYAVNRFNVVGVFTSTFNATAIGGGATDTTFNTT